MLQSIVIASAGLLLAASMPLARDALTDWVTIVIAAVSFVQLLTTKVDTLWIIMEASIISMSASALGLIDRHALYAGSSAFVPHQRAADLKVIHVT